MNSACVYSSKRNEALHDNTTTAEKMEDIYLEKRNVKRTSDGQDHNRACLEVYHFSMLTRSMDGMKTHKPQTVNIYHEESSNYSTMVMSI